MALNIKQKKKEDIKKVRNALNILSDYQNMIDMSDEANCKQETNSAKVLMKDLIQSL